MRAVLVIATLIAGCNGDDSSSRPSGDGGATDGGDAFAPAAPRLPAFECPAGWRPVDVSGVATCSPWPEAGPADCVVGQAHFPGEPGCAPVGGTCPAGEFPAGLPSDSPVTYVRSGASGGAGTMASPYGIDHPNVAAAVVGEVVALGKGDYDAEIILFAGVTMWGACAEETRLTTSVPAADRSVVHVVGEDVVLRGISIVDSDRTGLFVQRDGAALVEGVAVSRVRRVAISASGGDVELDGVAVRQTRGQLADMDFGRGIDLSMASTGTLRRIESLDNLEYGLRIADGGTLEAEDVAVRGTESLRTDGTLGRGLASEWGSTASLSRVVLEENRDVALLSQGAGGAMTASDVWIRGTLPVTSSLEDGRAVVASEGATASVMRVVADDNHEIALFASDPGSMLDVEDAVVRDTRLEMSDSSGGHGFHVQRQAAGSLRRAVLERNRTASVVGAESATLVASDLVVRDTLSRGDMLHGRGVNMETGATLDLERAVLEGNRELGVLAILAGSRVDASELVVRGTVPQDCAPGCANGAGGVGVGSYQQGTVTLSRFLLVDNGTCGMHVAREASLDASEGEVASNPIGACVQVDGYDVGRLSTDVAYRDNGTSLDVTTLPVPEPAVPAR